MSSVPPEMTGTGSRASWPLLSSAWLLPLQPMLFAVNRMLAGEPWASETLKPFAGKSVRLILTPLRVTLFINHQVRFELAQSNMVPDLTITVPAQHISAMAMAPERAEALLLIEGDSELAQALALVAKNLRPDIEEQLSRVVGDALSVRIVAACKGFAESASTARHRAAENVAEYLLEEQPMLVRGRDVLDLSALVRVLRDDLARLEKRIERLSSDL